MPLCLLWSQLTQQLGYQLYIWLQHTHARTPIHTNTHTPQSMITYQGFRVESWALTYRCYICRSLGLVVERPQCASLSPGQDCCMQPSDHMCTTVYRYIRYFYPL